MQPKTSKLRTNSVDSLTGANSGDNLGPGTPVIHFEQWERDDIEVKLILKGGGCENKNIQYSLPADLEGVGKAGRDLDGIRKCIMHAVYQAQGQGCSAGFIGVGIGGDRTSGYELAKHQLFRHVDDVNPHPELRKVEEYVMEHANTLGIGTMGFGGQVTLLGCKVGVMNRLPASFFVSVAYNCWAFRRQGVCSMLKRRNQRAGFIKRSGGRFQEASKRVRKTARHTPRRASRDRVDDADYRKSKFASLKVGDVVVINGTMHTGRDALHKYLMDHDAPVDLEWSGIYHCGPVMMQG